MDRGEGRIRNRSRGSSRKRRAIKGGERRVGESGETAEKKKKKEKEITGACEDGPPKDDDGVEAMLEPHSSAARR